MGVPDRSLRNVVAEDDEANASVTPIFWNGIEEGMKVAQKMSVSDTHPHERSVAASLHIALAGDPVMCPLYRETLARLGYDICTVVGTGQQLLEQCRLLRPDLVITGMKLPDEDISAAAEEMCREHPVPIILVTADHDAALLQRALANPYVLGCLFQPIKETDWGPAITLARRHFERLQSLQREVAELRQALEERKLVERAKGWVMRYVGLDEREAFCQLRKLANDQNRKLVEVAQEIVAAAEVFQQMEQPQQAEKPGNGFAWQDRKQWLAHRPGTVRCRVHHDSCSNPGGD
jgi:AmiR/NasT family two-component response regulator